MDEKSHVTALKQLQTRPVASYPSWLYPGASVEVSTRNSDKKWFNATVLEVLPFDSYYLPSMSPKSDRKKWKKSAKYFNRATIRIHMDPAGDSIITSFDWKAIQSSLRPSNIIVTPSPSFRPRLCVYCKCTVHCTVHTW